MCSESTRVSHQNPDQPGVLYVFFPQFSIHLKTLTHLDYAVHIRFVGDPQETARLLVITHTKHHPILKLRQFEIKLLDLTKLDQFSV